MTLFSNATGKGAYVENLLKQREILASEYAPETSPRPMIRTEIADTPKAQPSKFAQLKAQQRRSDTTGGIMRPKIRPDTSLLYQGQEYLRAIQDQEGPYAPEESPRPRPRLDGSESAFITTLAYAESSNKSSEQRQNKDGKYMTGTYQFSDARLDDYRKANKSKFSREDFRLDAALQDRVVKWHIKDIDRVIKEVDGEAKGFSKDGLRAVAHLGGNNGLKKFVKTGGKYNPSDELGTKLSDYYKRFSTFMKKD